MMKHVMCIFINLTLLWRRGWGIFVFFLYDGAYHKNMELYLF